MTLLNLLNRRRDYFYAFVIVILLLTVSFYLQFYRGMIPCPLCILQRVMLGCLSILFFLGAMKNFKNVYYRIIGGLSFIFSILGIILAGRQVWLQHSPIEPQNNCGVDLYYMLQAFPFDKVIKTIFAGTTECSTVAGRLFYLSLAEWSLIFFILFAVFALFQCFNNKIGK